MTEHSNIKQRVSVGAPRNKGPTVLPPVPVDNARPNANSHCLDKSTSWTLNKINYLRAYTYNVRSIAEDHKLDQLLIELENINWHIVGVSETHRMEEELLQLKVSNHLFYNKGRDDTKRSGVGFLVNKNIAGNCSAAGRPLFWGIIPGCHRMVSPCFRYTVSRCFGFLAPFFKVSSVSNSL